MEYIKNKIFRKKENFDPHKMIVRKIDNPDRGGIVPCLYD